MSLNDTYICYISVCNSKFKPRQLGVLIRGISIRGGDKRFLINNAFLFFKSKLCNNFLIHRVKLCIFNVFLWWNVTRSTFNWHNSSRFKSLQWFEIWIFFVARVVVCSIDILFSSNHNIHKSSYVPLFLGLIERF